MPPLPPFNPEQFKSVAEIPSTIGQKAAGHWAQQLVKLFPSTAATMLTPDYLAAITAIFTAFPERVVAAVCNPVHGIASKEQFFPSLASLRAHLDKAAAEAADRDRRERLSQRATEENPPSKPLKPAYKGPIENIKPGDILEGMHRIEEYERLMRSNGVNARLWGPHEKWEDSGARPAWGNLKPAPAKAEKTGQPTFLDRDSLLAKYKVSSEEFDAIPDAKDYNWNKPVVNVNRTVEPPENDLQQEESNPFE